MEGPNEKGRVRQRYEGGKGVSDTARGEKRSLGRRRAWVEARCTVS